MHRAGETGVVGADDADQLEGIILVLDLGADQRLFDGARLTLAVHRTGVPGGRHHGLIIFHFAPFDYDPVSESAARRFVQAHAAAGDFEGEIGEGRLARLQMKDPLLEFFGDQLAFDGAGGMAAENREKGVGRGVELLQHAVDHRLYFLVAGGVSCQHAGQRAGFEDFAVVAGRLGPAVGPGFVAVGQGTPLVGMHGAVVDEPAVVHLLGDLGRIEAAQFEVGPLDDPLGDVTVTLGQVGVAVHVEHPEGEELLAAGADAEVVAVAAGYQQHVGEVAGIDEIDQLVDLPQEGGHLVDRGGGRDAAGDDRHVVGHFAAENGHRLVGQTAHVESLDVVGHRRAVLFLRQPVVPFVAGNERAEVASADEILDLLQGRIAAAVVGAGRHVDVVEGAQLIEMQDVGLDVVGALDQVAQDAAVVGDAAGDAVGFVEGKGRSQAVGGGTDAADALHDAGRVTGIASLQNVLEPAVHHARTLGFLDHAVVHHRFDLQVPFDAGYRINYNLRCHLLSLLNGVC